MTRLAVVVLAGLIASGCASSRSLQAVTKDLGAAQAEIATLKESQERTSREGARLVADLKSLEEKLRELQGSLTDATSELAKLRSRLGSAEDAISRTRAELAARPVAVAAPAAPPPPPREPAVPPAETAFSAALAIFRAREHGQAVLDFTDFIARYPKHPLASSAQFWIGEAYFSQRDYRQALAEYQKVLEAGANGPKTADALLKVAQCYQSLREPARAQETLRKVIKDHPQSDAAARARALLRARASAQR